MSRYVPKPIKPEQITAIRAMASALNRRVEDFAFHASGCHTTSLQALSYKQAAMLIDVLNDYSKKTDDQ